VDGARSCRVVRGQAAYEGKQGLTYFTGVSADNTGAQALCLHLLVIPPLGRALAHVHEHHESAVFLVDGEAEVWWGERMEQHAAMRSGDFVYIPPGVPHVPVNTSATRPATAVVARTDPNEQESVRLRPDLDALVGGPGVVD
jgi:uncharacterized RmlC-like cupin family protein